MITSGIDIEKINEKFAILRKEIDQAGKLGLLNINKFCENLVKGLLEVSYNQKLINLNDEVINFPGLDLGSESSGVAYQVTSENTSSKVNETLTTIIRHGSQKRFPKIMFFMLTDKQVKYTINPTTDSSFIFDWKENIIDFDDLLKKIASSPPTQIRKTLELVESQLPYTIEKLKANEVIQENLINSLIKVEDDIAICNLKYYEHFSIKLNLFGGIFSVPTLYNGLNEVLNSQFKKSYLTIFSKERQKRNITTKELIYELPLQSTGGSTRFKHHVLSFKPNIICYEMAYYSSQEDFMGDSNFQVGGLLSLLIALKPIFKNVSYQVDVNVDHITNARVSFHPQNNICAVAHAMSTYYLMGLNSFSTMVHSIESSELIELVKEYLNGFVVENEVPFENPNPFLIVDELRQLHAITALKTIIGPTLSELDN